MKTENLFLYIVLLFVLMIAGHTLYGALTKAAEATAGRITATYDKR